MHLRLSQDEEGGLMSGTSELARVQLIEEARGQTISHARRNPERTVDLIHRLADALDAAPFMEHDNEGEKR